MRREDSRVHAPWMPWGCPDISVRGRFPEEPGNVWITHLLALPSPGLLIKPAVLWLEVYGLVGDEVPGPSLSSYEII
jgi:hypothetical protein